VFYHLANRGPGDSPASTTGIYLSTNTTFDPGDTLLATDSLGPLAAHQFDPIGQFRAVSIPTGGIAPGNYYIIAVADYANAIAETDETNNSSNAAALTVRSAPYDFNGDNRSDIFWQNTDGTTALWEMNGTGIIAIQAYDTDPKQTACEWAMEWIVCLG
jgi:subtilase family serine protease